MGNEWEPQACTSLPPGSEASSAARHGRRCAGSSSHRTGRSRTTKRLTSKTCYEAGGASSLPKVFGLFCFSNRNWSPYPHFSPGTLNALGAIWHERVTKIMMGAGALSMHHCDRHDSGPSGGVRVRSRVPPGQGQGGRRSGTGRLLERYRNYMGLLVRLQVVRLRRSVDIDDLLQDIWLEIHRKTQFRGVRSENFSHGCGACRAPSWPTMYVTTSPPSAATCDLSAHSPMNSTSLHFALSESLVVVAELVQPASSSARAGRPFGRRSQELPARLSRSDHSAAA